MTSSEASRWRQRNDALRAELISAGRRTEHLVAASEELLTAQDRFRDEFQSRSSTVEIAPRLGSVTVRGDGEISIYLNHAKAVVSDVNRLGERILTAVAKAEQDMRDAATRGFSIML